jgi:glycerol-3-phosphate dehydrogenase (NAD(P)+)
VGVLGGPLAPADLLEGRPTAAVIASRHPEVVEEFAAALSTPKLRIYRGRDPIGVELASGLGELLALAWGVASALGFGGPTRAVVLVRAVRELSRLISALGGDPATATGLAGLGDLLVRGADPASDAYRLGAQLASGAKPESNGRTARLSEGARAVRDLARRHAVHLHIFGGLADLLEGKLDAEGLVQRLMALPVLDD